MLSAEEIAEVMQKFQRLDNLKKVASAKGKAGAAEAGAGASTAARRGVRHCVTLTPCIVANAVDRCGYPQRFHRLVQEPLR